MVIWVWSFAIALSLRGLWLLVRAVLARPVPVGACPRCKYDRSGLASLSCPECACCKPPLTRARHRTRWRAAPGPVLCLPLLCLCFPTTTSRVIRAIVPYWSQHSRVVAHGVELRTFHPTEASTEWVKRLDDYHIDIDWVWDRHERLTLAASGRTIYDDAGFEISVLAGPASFHPTSLTQDDLDADGAPDLVLEYYPQDQRKYPDLIFARLGPTSRIVGRWHRVMYPQTQSIAGLDAAPHLSISTADPIWRYWNCCGACSPDAPILLKYVRGNLHLAARRMYAPLPTPETLASLAADMHQLFTDSSNPDIFWRPAVDLAYSGHPQAAIQLLQQACPGPDGDRFITDFIANLHKSPYWPALVEGFGDETNELNTFPSCDPILPLQPIK